MPPTLPPTLAQVKTPRKRLNNLATYRTIMGAARLGGPLFVCFPVMGETPPTRCDPLMGETLSSATYTCVNGIHTTKVTSRLGTRGRHPAAPTYSAGGTLPGGHDLPLHGLVQSRYATSPRLTRPVRSHGTQAGGGGPDRQVDRGRGAGVRWAAARSVSSVKALLVTVAKMSHNHEL